MKLVKKIGLCFFSKDFNRFKCEAAAEATVCRTLRLKKDQQYRVMNLRSNIAACLQRGQDPITSMVRNLVESLYREETVLEAYGYIEFYCDLVKDRLPVIERNRDCPENLKEGISSLIFAAGKCSNEIPELVTLKKIFEQKYGKEFVSSATKVRVNCRVDRRMIKNLAEFPPTPEERNNIVQEIINGCLGSGLQVNLLDINIDAAGQCSNQALIDTKIHKRITQD